MPNYKVRTLKGDKTHLVKDGNTLCGCGQKAYLVAKSSQLQCTCKLCIKLSKEKQS